MAHRVTYLSLQAWYNHTTQTNTHIYEWTHWKSCVCTEGHFTQIRANDNCEWETQNSTPLYHIALALYRLADHEHEVIGSTPEADGIALLYSNPQGRGRCVLSMPLLLYSPFISVHSRLFRNLLLSKCAALPISFNQHLSPAFSFPSISLPVSSTSPSPPPHSLWIRWVHSTFKDRESCDWKWIDTSASFARHCTV